MAVVKVDIAVESKGGLGSDLKRRARSEERWRLKKRVALKWSLRVFASEGGGVVAASSEWAMVNVVGIGDSSRLKKFRRAAVATGHAPE